MTLVSSGATTSAFKGEYLLTNGRHSNFSFQKCMFFCQSNYVLQRLKLCRTSDTVFRREIDSRRQWGYGTCYGGIVSPLRRSVHLGRQLQLSKGNICLLMEGTPTSAFKSACSFTQVRSINNDQVWTYIHPKCHFVQRMVLVVRG